MKLKKGDLLVAIGESVNNNLFVILDVERLPNSIIYYDVHYFKSYEIDLGSFCNALRQCYSGSKLVRYKEDAVEIFTNPFGGHNKIF